MVVGGGCDLNFGSGVAGEFGEGGGGVIPSEEGGLYYPLFVDAYDELLHGVGWAVAPGAGGDGAVGVGEVGHAVGVGVVDDAGRRGGVEAVVEGDQVGGGEDISSFGGAVGGGGMGAGVLGVDGGADLVDGGRVGRAGKPAAAFGGEGGAGFAVHGVEDGRRN